MVLKKIIEEVRADSNSHHAFTLENGRLHYKGRLVLSATSVWILKLIAEFHTTSMDFTVRLQNLKAMMRF